MSDRYCLNCNHKFFYSGARTCPNCGTRSSKVLQKGLVSQVIPEYIGPVQAPQSIEPVPIRVPQYTAETVPIQIPQYTAVQPIQIPQYIAAEPVQIPQYAASVQIPQYVAAEPVQVFQSVAAAPEPSRFEQFVKQHELSAKVANDLQRVLATCEIVLLCDDSGSMSSLISEPGSTKKSTRWAELKKLAAALIEISTCVNEKGLDLYFLNRPKQVSVNSMAGLSALFLKDPAGNTGITSKLTQIYNDKKDLLAKEKGKQLLIIVISDGEPTDNYGGSPRRNLFNEINRLTSMGNIHISFAECTDNEEDMAYLDDWDNRLKNFDNNDDYRSELRRVKTINGQSFKFDYTDYVIKIMLATFIKSYFNLDQGRYGSRYGY
ncbi:MAG: hypothetical protein Barrevirus1_63 [Barrevirus sp.]|uniref:VWFA domain-containing protein n=1 Tax=Barrevirus sp. TaxID=2487763 RepID=A0A3G4ZS55_9VIRU|nr:MAG: hypothetical protein Barrevirus1_63 [Barrevirus sp.]